MPEVHFLGELKSCRGFLPSRFSLTAKPTSLSASWSIQLRDERHWRLLEGDQSGKTWLADRSEPHYHAQWNTPFDFTYATTAVDGWPMMLLTVYETDSHERQDLGGYGVLRLPTTPGVHTRTVPISRPVGTWSDALHAFFIGGRPRYDAPDVLTTSDTRYGHQTQSMGMVEVEISVAMQGFEDPQLAHVSFEKSEAESDASSVCQGCSYAPTTTATNQADQKEANLPDAEEEEQKGDATSQPLLRKQQ